ncbi:MAG: GIY-YIG nuclease family protein [Minisyncoccia bacterium]
MPGVYIFYNNQNPLYIGKASNLKERLKSYLQKDSLKNISLQKEANELVWHTLKSEIEALLLESKLIKILKPKYNVLFKDDKNYFYVYFTIDEFPYYYKNISIIKNILSGASNKIPKKYYLLKR